MSKNLQIDMIIQTKPHWQQDNMDDMLGYNPESEEDEEREKKMGARLFQLRKSIRDNQYNGHYYDRSYGWRGRNERRYIRNRRQAKRFSEKRKMA